MMEIRTMRKVGILVNSIGYGGNERSAVNIAQAMNCEFDVYIIIQEDCGNHYDYKGKVICLDTPCAKSMIGKVINSLRRIVRLRKIIKNICLDTLLIILPVTNPINYLRFGCKKIVSCRDCGDLFRRTKKYIRMTEKSDMIVCNSIVQADFIKRTKPGLGEKTGIIYNILDIKNISVLRDETIELSVKKFMLGKKCIISSGRFVNAKGFNNLIKAFSELASIEKDARLLIIGDGELRECIEKLISDLNLRDKVMLLGFQKNPFKYISRSDLFVLSSFYEGFPNTLVEAMACNCPVVATDCPSGPAEILCGNIGTGYTITKFGILTECFHEEESTWESEDIRPQHIILSTAMREVLKDKKLANQLVDNAQQRVEDFSAERISDNWGKIL